MERVAVWLGGPRHRVILIGAVLFMVPLLMPLSAGLIAFATLLKGPREGALAALGAAVVLSVVMAVSGGQVLAMFAASLLLLAATVAGASLAGRSGSLDLAFQLGTLGFALLAAVLAGTPTGQTLAGQIAPEFAQALVNAGAAADEAAAMAEMVARLLFGLALGGMLLTLTMALLLGRWLEGLVRPPQQAGSNFRALKLGRLVTIVASVVLVGALLTQGTGALGNAAIVLVLAMVLQGLAVVHAVFKRMGLHSGWLVLVYVLLLPLTQLSAFMLMAVASTGYLDNWLGFRRVRERRPPDDSLD